MQKILITGLDGSGKTTILEKIKVFEKELSLQVVNLPLLRTDIYSNDKNLKDAIQFLNTLNSEADKKQIPQLKAIAMLLSMFLYRYIEKKAANQNIKTLICERHPLIDAGIYAVFYATKLTPGSINKQILDKIDLDNKHSLEFIESIAPKQLTTQFQISKLDSVRSLIYNKFGLEWENTEKNITNFFELDYPEKIFFLDAKPENLIARIQNRKQMEAHEQKAVLKKLDDLYKDKFIKIANKTDVSFIPADQFAQLDNFAEKIMSILKHEA